VTLLIEGEMEVGYEEVRCNDGDLASGIYFVSIQTGCFVETRKLILLK
jgi:hypothetical protein